MATHSPPQLLLKDNQDYSSEEANMPSGADIQAVNIGSDVYPECGKRLTKQSSRALNDDFRYEVEKRKMQCS